MSGSARGGPLCVVGMHRSGTSLVTRMLVALGMDIGPEATLVEPDPDDNPDGYQEQWAIVKFHDRLLRELGGHASEPPPALAAGWEDAPELADFRDEAGRLLDELFSREPCGFKDPRASLLLPFWRRVRPDIRVVICLRDASAVADSMLRRRGPYSRGHWIEVGRRHTADAIRDSEGLERVEVVYEETLADPRAAAAALGRFLLGREADPERVARAAALPVR